MSANHPVADAFLCVGLCGIGGWWAAHAAEINTDVQIAAGILTAIAATISLAARFKIKKR